MGGNTQHRKRERERGQESVRITAADTRRHLRDAFREVQRISTCWIPGHYCTRLVLRGPHTYRPMTREVKRRVMISQISALFAQSPSLSLSPAVAERIMFSRTCSFLTRYLGRSFDADPSDQPTTREVHKRGANPLSLSRCC